MPSGAKMFGVSAMRAKIAQFQRAFPDRVAGALFMEAQIEMTESKKRCPVDITPDAPHPGQLRASGRVEQPVRRGRIITVALTYGTDYAFWVHEVLTNFHPIGQARYLISVLEQSAAYMAARVGRRLKV